MKASTLEAAIPKGRKPSGKQQRVLVEFDKAGAEWVVVAYASGDARMIEVVESGKSPHPITGNYITRVPIPLIERESKLVKMLTDPVEIERIRRENLPDLFKQDYFLPRTMSIRQLGKKSNHGLNYIMGPGEFSVIGEMDQGEAKRVIHLYTHQAYPNIPLWWQSVERALKNNNRVIDNCFGRRRRFLEQWGRDLLKQAVAYIPQSTVVDLVNEGMIKAYNDNDLMKTWDLLAQVHDSLLFQSLVTDWKLFAKQCIKVALDYMNAECEYGGRKFRIGTDCKIGPSWGKMEAVKLSMDIDKVAKDLRSAWEKANHVEARAA